MNLHTPDAKTHGPRRCFHFAYSQSGRNDRPPLPHQSRDGESFSLMQQVLQRQGYEYEGPIFNFPCPHPTAYDHELDDDLLLRSVRDGDLWATTTRLPLDDEIDGVKCRVDRSHTAAEKRVVALVRRHLSHCSRRQVTVADVHVRAFPEVAKLRNVEFHQKQGAAIKCYLPAGSLHWQRPPSGSGRSLAYLIYEKNAWPGGPSFLAAFGMCGVDTLVWNYMLAKRFPTLIGSVPFAMAELIAPKKLPMRPPTLEFANEWQVRLLTVSSPPDVHLGRCTAA